MSALDVLRQIKQARRAQMSNVRIVEWGNAEYINSIGIDNLTRKELRNHLEARDLDTTGTRLELLERLRGSLVDEQLHKFAYVETLDTEQQIEADMEERGSVYVSGGNQNGQLGLGDKEPRRYFTVVRPLRGVGVVYVACSADMCYAVTEEHDVYVWGGGGVGRTGLNPALMKKSVTDSNVINNYMEPQIVPDLAGEEVSEVSMGSSHTIAVGRGGDCFVWGDGDSGQLGLGKLDNKPMISINNSFPSVMQVSAGANHTAVLTKAGQVYTWGHGANGRLGVGDTERNGVPENQRAFFPVPVCLRSLEPIKQISCGTDHTLAAGNAGVWAWGNGSGGKLGLGDTKDRYEPCLVPTLR
eukprot:gene27194-30739_t